MKEVLKIFKALGDENRMRILFMLKERPLCVCEIAEVLNIALSTISAHLRLMKNSGLIEDKKEGRWVIYNINKDNVYFCRLLHFIEEQMREDPQISRDRVLISQITREVCAKK